MRIFFSFAALLISNLGWSYQAVPGEYLVQLKPQIKLFSLGQTPIEKTKSLSKLLQANVIKVIGEDIVLIKGAKPLSQNQLIQTIEPNYLYRLNMEPNDPLYGDSWGLSNHGQVDSKGIAGHHGVDINVQAAWNITTGSEKIIVAVIDSGIDFTHQDLKENAWVNLPEANGKPGLDDDGNGYIDDINGWDFALNTPLQKDISGHGTHCAGTIGAKGNDGIGIAGINWNIQIMSLKFFDDEGYGSQAAAIEAIRYAMKMKVRITSNSWGGGPYSEILQSVIKEAGDAEVLFVASAGNDGENSDQNPHYPSSYPLSNIISVGAITNQGSLTKYSNYGAKSVHITAPGKGILSTIPGNEYEIKSGTSMATPFVAGVAALVLSKENLSVQELKSRLLSTATPLPELQGKILSGGLVNAGRAISEVPKF